MLKGILLGILMQCISVVGYLMIANVTSIKSEVFRTGLMIAFAGIVALIAMDTRCSLGSSAWRRSGRKTRSTLRSARSW